MKTTIHAADEVIFEKKGVNIRKNTDAKAVLYPYFYGYPWRIKYIKVEIADRDRIIFLSLQTCAEWACASWDAAGIAHR